jgi:hypothetical protein
MSHPLTSEFSSTGFVQRVDTVPDKIPAYDPRSGDHYWVMLLSYHIIDPSKFEKGDILLDTENLVSVTGPGCYYCENMYTSLLLTRRCPGPS